MSVRRIALAWTPEGWPAASRAIDALRERGYRLIFWSHEKLIEREIPHFYFASVEKKSWRVFR